MGNKAVKENDTVNTELTEVSHSDTKHLLPEQIDKQNSYHAVDDSNDTNRQKEESNDDKMSCSHCSKWKRVEDMSYLQRGQHISFNGMHCTRHYGCINKQVFFYKHHVIIDKVTERHSRYKATVVCIHFSKDEQRKCRTCCNKCTIFKEKFTFDLEKDELYVIEYQYPRYTPDVIVQRAVSKVDRIENGEECVCYSLCCSNCEHFATECVVGESTSFQAKHCGYCCIRCISSVLSQARTWVKLAIRLLYNSSDEIATAVIHDRACAIAVLVIVVVGYIIYSLVMTICLYNKYGEKKICKSCFKVNRSDLCVQCIAFILISVFSFAIMFWLVSPCSLFYEVCIAFLLGLFSTVLYWVILRVRRALKSPFHCNTKYITTLSEVKPGDVVSLTYYGLNRLILVSNVMCLTDTKQGTVRGIHYSLPGLCSKREIKEKCFLVDLRKSTLKVLQLEGLNTFSPEEALDRAGKRIGEKKWRMFSNRSAHLCYWAKIKDNQNSTDTEGEQSSSFTQAEQSSSFTQAEQSSSVTQAEQSSTVTPPLPPNEEIGKPYSRHLSSLFIRKADVHLMNEIELGDVVECKSDKGIVVSLTEVNNSTGSMKGRTFNIEIVVHKGPFEPCGMSVSRTINLDTDTLVIHKYHPAHCVSRDERVRKACDRVGKPSNFKCQSGFIVDILKHQGEY